MTTQLRGTATRGSHRWSSRDFGPEFLRRLSDSPAEGDPGAYCPHKPTAKQREFLACEDLEVMYGGAAGGGKSEALLMAAEQYLTVPGYAALILRRTYPDLVLPGAIMDRAREWLRGTSARWYEKEKTWRFPSGASLTFGYLQYEKDKYRYQGAEFQFIGFDEVTQFTEGQYRYLLSRLRRLSGATVPIRARCASNPGGVGHAWVKARFVDPTTSEGRRFIPARLEDNPYLDVEEYGRALELLDPITRQQLREGDWTVRAPGGLFDRAWFDVLDAPPADVVARVVRWDLASSEASPGTDPDWTVGVVMSVTADGLYAVEDVIRARKNPAGVEALVRSTAAAYGPGVPIVLPQDPGQAGKAQVSYFATKVLPGYDVRRIIETGDKVTRARPFSAMASNGKVAVVRGAWLPAWFDELESFPGTAHDDQVDASAGAFSWLALRDDTDWEVYDDD